MNKGQDEVTSDLQQEKLIFLDPQKNDWVTEDEYLSGNVRNKLKLAEQAAAEDSRYAPNVEALQAVQPTHIPPGDIEVRLGAAWVPQTDIRDFVGHLLDDSSGVIVQYSSYLDVWSVDADYRVTGSVKNTKVHGTDRVGAIRLIELGLNLKDPVVYDKVDDRLVVNQDDTAAARMKLEEIKVAFKDWIWQDPGRTERLTDLYNDKFNTFRPRQYNGAHLELPGSNPAIQLRPHQKDATWRVLQEGNSLLAHCVGAGKTFTTIAAVMEQKRLGIVNKPMIVVPNHLLEQWAGDFKRLYPNSNILAATKDDSSAQNRQELMSRIATGNWDAVIVTHTAFGKLKMSKDAQLDFYRAELDLVQDAASEAKSNGSSRSIVKELERQKKRLQKRIDEVANKQKDNTVTFEQLGVDQIYVDEAHYFKNLGYHTKMYGISGLPNTTSDRAFDLFMKCRYLGQQYGEGKGVVFATGTPVSNSMAELYTMQRYLQPQALRQIGLEKFDAWASTFGETVTAPEITPAGGYKVKTRFSRFVNIPELMNTFRQVADIQTAEMLNLPTPQLKGGKPEVVAVPASDIQLAFVEELARRAENIRNVDPKIDNMLLITTDGRKASLDMRLINPYLPHERNKIDQLIEDAYQFWDDTRADRSTHLIFCDMGTPKEDAGSKKSQQINVQKQFTVYGYIKDGLIARGVPAEEIAFAQDFKTDAQKLEMQQKFNAGKLRVLISGSQLETGFNGQKKLGLESHITVPWRPDQVEQRDGRILRQGNQNLEVSIRRYVTQGRDGRPSFDSYMWQTLETKKKFISQVMAGNSEIRTMEDISDAALTYAEVKAIATGNPLILEKAEVDNRVSQLAAQKRSHLNQHYSINREIKDIPNRVDYLVGQIAALKADLQRVPPNPMSPTVVVQGVPFDDLREAMKAVKARALEKQMVKDFSPETIGKVGGFGLQLQRSRWGDDINLIVQGQQSYLCPIEHTYVGTAENLVHALLNIQPDIEEAERRLANTRQRLVELSQHSNDPFPKEDELQAALKRQTEINTALGLNENNAQASVETEEEATQPEDETVEDNQEITASTSASEWAAALLQPEQTEEVATSLEAPQPDAVETVEIAAEEAIATPEAELIPDDAHLQVIPLQAEQRLRAAVAVNDSDAIQQFIEQVTGEIGSWSIEEKVALVESIETPEPRLGDVVGEIIGRVIDAQEQQGTSTDEALSALRQEVSTAFLTDENDQAIATTTQVPVSIESSDTGLDQGRREELAQADEILRVAAIAYAYAGSKGQIQFDGEFWTAQGKHYDISYNPTNENFFVVGKEDSQMEAQSIGGQIDPDCCGDITPEDVERFKKTEATLQTLQATFNSSQAPDQTQAIAQQQQTPPPLTEELKTWHQQALEIGHSQAYLQRIEQVQQALESGESPTERAIQAMRVDQRAWKGQIASVMADAATILSQAGTQDTAGKHFNGKTYQIALRLDGELIVAATNRGEILQAKDGAIVSSSITKLDAERFQKFVNQLQAATQTRVAERGSEYGD